MMSSPAQVFEMFEASVEVGIGLGVAYFRRLCGFVQRRYSTFGVV